MDRSQKLQDGCKNVVTNSETAENMNKPNNLDNTVENLNSDVEEHSEGLGSTPLSRTSPEMDDIAYFNELFDWNLIEERLKNSNSMDGHEQFISILEKQNTKISTQAASVKLREKQSSMPMSEAQRKRRSRDLLQNRRSTGYLTFEDFENAIKEIEEISMKTEENFQRDLESLKDNASTTKNPGDNSNQCDNKEDCNSIIDETDHSPVILRDKKSSSPFNSASSRKRRSRNLLLNRRSTGYVSVEDVEKAKSMDQQDIDDAD